MTFVSYAQNFEDVLLWRALHFVTPGFYIDVGAWHPDDDSVTRAFYDRGWHGINIEPSMAGFKRLTDARPRDVNLQVAIGAEAGTATFFGFEGGLSGLNTLDAEAVTGYAARGWAAQETMVAVDTLASVCRQHVTGEIHFLKIDVEGAERAVLEGADFTAFRPWVLVIEATAPMSQAPVHGAWEDLVLAGGYGFAWFDGLNRYYIAAERAEMLAPSFTRPPNVFDDFLKASDTDWAHRIGQAEARAEALMSRAVHAELQAAVALDRATGANLRLVRSSVEASRAHALASARADEVVRMAAALADQVHRAEAAEAWVSAMQSSTSWRVTGPIRRAMRLAGRSAGVSVVDVTAGGGAAVESGVVSANVPRVDSGSDRSRRAVRAVHQFHSGSAYGDAITNAMLLTRDLLRRLGYESRIFVEHRDANFSAPFHLLDELPEGDGYVLIVRHSMGHDALARILALPVRKVLIYHNITPPELLEGSPFLQRYARLGREQLALLRPAVAASLADSEYNALELRREGFKAVSVCTLLFDLAKMDAPPPGQRKEAGRVFSMLFVGRVAASKGQMELVAAFAQFRTAYAGESRLVLVGREEGGDYLTALYALIRARGLDTGAVEMAGVVDDAELERRYAEADLYVSASMHEGFGVPLVEAMARGVPVLACASGAVPYTVGDGAMLVEDAAPAAIAGHMLALARDPVLRAALAERARAVLPRFNLARQAPVLIDALVAAGAERVATLDTRAALSANMRFTVAGHVNGTYSLAEVNRALALGLEAARPGSVRLIAVEGDVTTGVLGVPAEQRDAVGALLARGAPFTGPEVVISQHYPVWVPPERGDLAVALFFWEESLVPGGTVQALNTGFAGVLAPSRTVAKALIDSGVSAPVRVVGQAPNLVAFRELREARLVQTGEGRPFTFLHVSSCFPRKGVDVLLAAYARAFRREDAVRLVIKGFPNPHNTVGADLATLQAVDAGLAPVELIDRDIGAAELLALYGEADAMVLPTRGEGYNLPAAEAVAAGLPLIVTGWGGHMDMLEGAPDSAVRLLKYGFVPSSSHLATPFSLWTEPDEDDLVAAMREAFQREVVSVDGEAPGWAPAGTDVAEMVSGFATELLLAPAAVELAVSWVTTWDVRCGVAEYSRQLVSAVPGPSTIFSDLRGTASLPGAERTVIPVWQAGEMETMTALARAIVRHDPGAVVVQHQPGLLHWDMLAALLSAPALSARIVCATLHNTRNLVDVAPAIQADVVRALGAISRVVVHTLQDVNMLATLGLAANVTLIPQGAPAVHSLSGVGAASPLRELEASGADVLIGCYGFFLPGKGVPELIEALALLRRRWPAARLRLVNAEYPHPLSAEEIEACRNVAHEAGITANVEFVTGFLRHSESAALLQACDLVVLPYQHSKESSSAAMRSALAAGVPVAVTPLSIFDEAEAAVIRLPGITAAEISAGIERALMDRCVRGAVVEAAAAWLGERSWAAVGARWSGMLKGLVASRVVAK